LNASISQFVSELSGTDMSQLEVVQYGGYQRIALANEPLAERLTLDMDLWYQSSSSGTTTRLGEVVVAELKQQKQSKSSPFYQLMSWLGYSPISFSKYCVGCALLFGKQADANIFVDGQIKTNRFKPLLNRIEQIAKQD